MYPLWGHNHGNEKDFMTDTDVDAVDGFLGQTTGFRRSLIKESVIVLGEVEGTEVVKYIHGRVGKGTFTFYGATIRRTTSTMSATRRRGCPCSPTPPGTA